VEALAHGISHDLGAHIRALDSFATFLRQDAGQLPPAAQEDLARIEGATARLRAGLDGLVAYLRSPDAGAGAGSLDEAARATARLLGPRFAERGGSIAVEGSASRVAVSTERLARVLGRLVENAIASSASRVRLTLERADSRARITIADDGPGLTEAERARAVEPFARLRPRASGEMRTGLGLATVARAVRAWGGTLSLGPSHEGGLEARIELPRADAA
jgi:signal transduction histidine kinase